MKITKATITEVELLIANANRAAEEVKEIKAALKALKLKLEACLDSEAK